MHDSPSILRRLLPVAVALFAPFAQASPIARAVPAAGAPAQRQAELAPGAERGAATPLQDGAAAPATEGADAAPAAPILALPTARFDDLRAAWRDRREALARDDGPAADAAVNRLRGLVRELGVDELDAYGAAAAWESRRLRWSDPAAALQRADLAVSLAPSLPAAHASRLAARFASNPWDVEGWVGAGLDAVAASFGREGARRHLLADLGVAAGLAFSVAGAFTLLLLALRYGRHALHDFHHLFPRRTAKIQTDALALLVLAAPLALGLGPLPVAALVVAGTWMYLRRVERVVVAVWLMGMGLLPVGATWLSARTAWSGTLAQRLDAIDRGGAFDAAEALEQGIQAKAPRPEALFVLARVKKRQGDLEGAKALYQRALSSRPGWPVASVGLGNVLFALGDLKGAEHLYEQAVSAAPDLAAGWFGLSRVHYRQVAFMSGQRERDRAIALDRSLVERYATAQGESPAANRFLVDPRLGRRDLVPLAVPPGAGDALGAQVADLLLPGLPPSTTALLAAAVVALLALALVAGRKLQFARACGRCGRSVCFRCNPEARGGTDCGHCIHVFGRHAAVDPTARVSKERAVRRYRDRKRFLLRASALVLAAPALNGRALHTAFFVFLCAFLALLLAFGDGLIRPVFAAGAGPLRVATIAPVLVAIYLWRLWAGLREGG